MKMRVSIAELTNTATAEFGVYHVHVVCDTMNDVFNILRRHMPMTEVNYATIKSRKALIELQRADLPITSKENVK